MGFFEIGQCLGGMLVEAQDVTEQEQAAGKLWAVSWERLAEDVDSGVECFKRSVHIAERQATARQLMPELGDLGMTVAEMLALDGQCAFVETHRFFSGALLARQTREVPQRVREARARAIGAFVARDRTFVKGPRLGPVASLLRKLAQCHRGCRR